MVTFSLDFVKRTNVNMFAVASSIWSFCKNKNGPDQAHFFLCGVLSGDAGKFYTTA